MKTYNARFTTSILATIAFAILTATTFLLSLSAHAEFAEGSKSIQVNFGYTKGGAALGADFEYAHDRTYGIGGYIRMYPDNDDPSAAGVTAFGAFIRPHFNRQSWDLYISPGFGMINYEPRNRDDEMLLGPSLAIGLLYEFTPNVSFGVEEMRLYSWFGDEDYRGKIDDDFLSAKFRFIF